MSKYHCRRSFSKIGKWEVLHNESVLVVVPDQNTAIEVIRLLHIHAPRTQGLTINGVPLT